MLTYLSDVWGCRYFWYSLVRMDLRQRYRRSVLGIGWSLSHPISMTIVVCTVFHHVFGMNIREHGPFFLAGLSFWMFMSTTITFGCSAFSQGEGYIRQSPAPLAIYPLRVVLGAAFHFALSLGVALVVTWGFQGFGNLPGLVWLVPGLLMLLVLAWSLAILAALANAYFPDTSHLVEMVMQLLFYATPILYTPQMLRDRGLGWIVNCNPFATFLEIVRVPILQGTSPPIGIYLACLAYLAVAAVAAMLLLRRLQAKLIFQL